MLCLHSIAEKMFTETEQEEIINNEFLTQIEQKETTIIDDCLYDKSEEYDSCGFVTAKKRESDEHSTMIQSIEH